MKKILILSGLTLSNVSFANEEGVRELAYSTVEGLGVLAAQYQGADDFKATVEQFMDEVINGLNRVFGPQFYSTLLLNRIEPKLDELTAKVTTLITEKLANIEPKRKVFKVLLSVFPGVNTFLVEEIVAPILNTQLKRLIMDVLDGSGKNIISSK